MSGWFPKGEIHLRRWTAQECLRFLDERFTAVRKGVYRLHFVQAGRLDGRLQSHGRFRLVYRLTTAIHSGVLVLRGSVVDAPDGCTIRYATHVQRLTLAFWIIWTLALLGVIALSFLAPGAGSSSRVMLVAVILLLVPPLIVASVRRGRQDVEVALAELRSWFDDPVAGESAGDAPATE